MWLWHHFQGSKVNLQGAWHIVAASRTTCPAFLLSMCLYVHSRATVIVFADMCCIRVLPLGCYGLYVRCRGFGVKVHYLRWCMPPFMRQCWGPPHRLGQCLRLQGWGKLVNAALLSLITEACVNVCCATLLSSELVGPTCVQAWSSNPRSRACRPNGKGLEN